MTVNLYKIFSERLKEAIRDWGGPKVPFYKFAEAVDIHENVIYTYTAGRFLPSTINLYLLCKFLNVSADWLLGLTDVKERKNYSSHNE